MDVQCCECVQATHYLIKMGNKQTIFTDEQLDAYQVSFHACVYLQHVGECIQNHVKDKTFFVSKW